MYGQSLCTAQQVCLIATQNQNIRVITEHLSSLIWKQTNSNIIWKAWMPLALQQLSSAVSPSPSSLLRNATLKTILAFNLVFLIKQSSLDSIADIADITGIPYEPNQNSIEIYIHIFCTLMVGTLALCPHNTHSVHTPDPIRPSGSGMEKTRNTQTPADGPPHDPPYLSNMNGSAKYPSNNFPVNIIIVLICTLLLKLL